jgi:hypothetical protein
MVMKIKEIDKIIAERDKWKRRAKLFQEAYRDADFRALALEIQKMQLEALGTDKVTAMQNKHLLKKLISVCVERNELAARLKKYE